MFLPVQALQVLLVAWEPEIYRAQIWGCTVHPNMNKNGWPAHYPGGACWPVRTNDRYYTVHTGILYLYCIIHVIVKIVAIRAAFSGVSNIFYLATNNTENF